MHSQLELNAIEAISLLSGLGELAQSSLSAIAAAPLPQEAPSAPGAEPRGAVVPTPEEIPVRYVSEKPEYRPALSNEALIQALLQLSRTPAPQPAQRQEPAIPRAAAPESAAPASGEASAPDFSPVTPPEVSAQPKPGPFLKRRSGQTQTILR